ncbi:MAG: hypothetical protein WC781_01300 [Candidatus Pacearchaeota archaeon]|jgi:hypothetical protein
MTCANWGITILALIILALTFWPTILSSEITKWVLIISAVLIIIIVWTGCKCKWCEKASKKK